MQTSALIFFVYWTSGVFNVVTGGGAMGQTLAEHPDVDKVATKPTLLSQFT